ncbi:MAG: hypothetical protein IJK14_01615 [Clostridia bacterium]|nr:hypothetical protein [Clostridia bacterium]
MACFLIPTVEAIAVTALAKVMESKEVSRDIAKVQKDSESLEVAGKVPFSRKLKWLRNLLWGGSALLAFEHVWHGEVVPWFPFLTAAADPADAAEMLHEMAIIGVTMAVLVTAVWGVMLAVSSSVEKRAPKVQPAEN